MLAASTYVFDNAWREERRRLSLLEQGWDPTTIQHLEALGVGSGWRCLEVGGGGGSIAAWLCERLGSSGGVVVTDLDTRFLDALPYADLDVRAHDIVHDGLETGSYDLVHARLLLEHLPERHLALGKMVAALRPGGWLLVEEFDHATFAPALDSRREFKAVWAAFSAAFEALAVQRGLDLRYGSRLFSDLKQRGLDEAGARGRTQVQTGGSALSEVLALSAVSMRDALISTGLIDEPILDAFVALLRDPASCWTTQLMVSAWGRRPAG